MTISLSKLTALEAALEYLIKATPGEKLEYLAPGEKPPGEIPIRTTRRGARGYYPSEVAGGEEEAAAPREAEPTEEREMEAVQAPEVEVKDNPWDLTRKEFNKKYVWHHTSFENAFQIQKEGMKKGVFGIGGNREGFPGAVTIFARRSDVEALNPSIESFGRGQALYPEGAYSPTKEWKTSLSPDKLFIVPRESEKDPYEFLVRQKPITQEEQEEQDAKDEANRPKAAIGGGITGSVDLIETVEGVDLGIKSGELHKLNRYWYHNPPPDQRGGASDGGIQSYLPGIPERSPIGNIEHVWLSPGGPVHGPPVTSISDSRLHDNDFILRIIDITKLNPDALRLANDGYIQHRGDIPFDAIIDQKQATDKTSDNLSKLLVDTVTSADDSIRIGNLNIPIEVATDPASGLSGRDKLAPSTGMLFIFDKSPVITMKGMKFPLDIVWMADNKVVDLTENALVPVLESASLYTPKKHATTALEINGGEIQTLGIKIGDSVEDAGSTQSNLSKLLVLETALEYFIKAETGKREYLAPGEKAPEGLKEHPGSRPGVRYYVPGESQSKQEFPSMHTIASPELPEEEREIEAVSPESDWDSSVPAIWDSFERRLRVREEEEKEETARQKGETSSEDDSRKQFATMANDLEDVLSSINPEHKQFLGTPFDDSKLIGDNLEYVAFTDGSFEGSIRPSGSGIHSEFNWTTFIDGKPFLYKVVSGENRAEHLSYSIDRALGLNVVPYIKPYNMDIDQLHKVFQRSQKEPVVNRILSTVVGQGGSPPHLFSDYVIEEAKDRVAGKGGGNPAAAGHFMEFCETCPDSEESAAIIADMLTTKEGREEFFKLMLLDYVSGNDDRHSGNWLVTEDKKVLAIDNGFAGEGGYAPLDETLTRDVGRIGYSMKLGFPFRTQSALKAHLMDLDLEQNEIQEYMTKLQDPEMLGEEAENIFDKYYNLEKIQKALAPINWDAQSVWPNADDARGAFRNHAVKWMIRGMGGKVEGDYSSEVPDGAPDSSFLWIPSTPVKAINDTPEPFELPGHFRENKPSGFLNRIRNWIRLGGPEPKSSAPSSRGFHPEFEGDTPPSQRGGPQQGRRGRN